MLPVPPRRDQRPCPLPRAGRDQRPWPVPPAGRAPAASGTLLPVNRPATPKPVARPRRSLVACLPHPLVLVLAAALSATAAPGPFAGTPHCPGSAPAPPVGERSRGGCVMPAVVHRVVATASKATEAGAIGPGTTGLGVAGLERGRPPEAAIVWRRSRAVGLPNRGRLRGGVELPAAGTHFVTVDPVAGAGPNRAWRRHGTDRLVALLLRVAADHAAAHPDAPRLVVGDLSRPRGGRFGPELGGDGHRSHQNGLDADVFYPRRDGLERIPRRVGQVDRRLAQELVDRFVRAGAEYVFVGPRTGLRGPPKVVMVLGNHDDHLHVRIRPATRARR
jgi:Penicillin-insensitive murein endopeptidase